MLKVTQQIKARTGTPMALFTVTQGVAGSLGEATADHRPSRGPVLLSRENDAWLGSETAWDCPGQRGTSPGHRAGDITEGSCLGGQRVGSWAQRGSETGPGTPEQPVASQGLGEFPCPRTRAGKGLAERVPLAPGPRLQWRRSPCGQRAAGWRPGEGPCGGGARSQGPSVGLASQQQQQQPGPLANVAGAWGPDTDRSAASRLGICW